jgi:hypothetical protein
VCAHRGQSLVAGSRGNFTLLPVLALPLLAPRGTPPLLVLPSRAGQGCWQGGGGGGSALALLTREGPPGGIIVGRNSGFFWKWGLTATAVGFGERGEFFLRHRAEVVVADS